MASWFIILWNCKHREVTLLNLKRISAQFFTGFVVVILGFLFHFGGFWFGFLVGLGFCGGLFFFNI